MEGEDNERKEFIKVSFAKLQAISSDDIVIHEGTEFHCYGNAFKTTDNDEDDKDEWVVRLYHAIKNNTPNQHHSILPIQKQVSCIATEAINI